MSAKNKTEIKADIASTFVPTLQIADHEDFLANALADSAVLKKDVKTTAPAAVGSVITLDYTNTDTYNNATIGSSTTFTITNLADGQIGYIAFFKNPGAVISFSNATNVTSNQPYVDQIGGNFVYQLSNKDGVIYATCINNTIIKFSDVINKNQTENNKYLTPVNFAIVTPTPTIQDAGVISFSTTPYVKIQKSGLINIRIGFTAQTTVTAGAITLCNVGTSLVPYFSELFSTALFVIFWQNVYLYFTSELEYKTVPCLFQLYGNGDIKMRISGGRRLNTSDQFLIDTMIMP